MSGSWSNPSAPNLADYTLFLENSVGISTTDLPADSPWIGYAFNRGLALTLNVGCAPGIEYTLAVYNCAAHVQFLITPDQSGQTFFQNARSAQGFNLVGMPTGFLSASEDQGTSQSMDVPAALQQLSLTDLDFMRTPWGRQWLEYGMDFGQPWGLT